MEPGFPVWTIRPNWREGVMERLEWLTDVLVAQSSGAEQRRSLRISPRRFIEITVHPTRQERSFLDLQLHRNGSAMWLFPIWFDVAKLSAPVEALDERVEFDNAFREHGLGGYALLFKDAFTWEVISVAASDDDGLDLAAPIEGTWPAGTQIYPLRFARLPMETSLAAITNRVGESVLMWQIAQANDFVETEPTDLEFEGVPVLNVPPNRSNEITLDHVRLAEEHDNRTGVPWRTDPIGRAFQIQGHNWFITGRQAHAQFRAMLYWLRGRQKAVWLPSFNDDIIVTRPSAMASLNLDIERIGLAYSGGLTPGRDVVLVNGVPARVTELGVPQSESEERLRIGAGLSAAIPAGSTGSFLSMCRLNQDAVELMHHTDIDGLTEASATFQTFADTRDPSGTIYDPIPEAGKFSGQCGSSFILLNPNFEEGAVGWQGQFAVRNDTPNGQPPVNGSLIGWSGVTSFGEFYQTLSIPTRYLAKVDAGLVSISGYTGYHVTYVSQSDHGQLFIAFINAAGAITGEVTSPMDYSKVWTLLTVPTSVIPAGTRKLRFGTRNIRDEGANCDSYWDAMTPGILVVAE